MAKIPRKNQKIFALNAANNGVFGSAQDGTKVLSNDVETLQSKAAWLLGWLNATISGDKLPTLEEMQAIQYIFSSQLAYIFQEGIPEYNALTTYFVNSVVKKAGTYQLYGSITNDNTGNALTDAANWKYLLDLQNPNTIVTWGGTAGGTANALTLTPTPALSAYGTGGQIIAFMPASDNTGAATVNISGLGVINITKGGTTALAPKDLKSGKLAFGIYDGTQLQLINSGIWGHGADIAAVATLNLDAATGHIVDVTGNTGITAVTLAEGSVRFVRLTGTPLITNGASLVVQGGANYQGAAGDFIMFVGYASSVVRAFIFKADGTSITSSQLRTFYATTSGNFTTPANITTNTRFKVILLGGGSGASGNAVATQGNGGNAGGRVEHEFTGLSPSTAYAFTIGAGGAGGAAGANAGIVGGNSTLTWNGVTLTANGGAATSATPGTVTSGGTASGGNIANVQGAEGGGGCTSNNGNSGGSGAGTIYGTGGGGKGGNVGTTQPGNNANNPGAGGGASGNNASASSAGGNGAPGAIQVQYVA